jgi:hypothetical protein
MAVLKWQHRAVNEPEGPSVLLAPAALSASLTCILSLMITLFLALALAALSASAVELTEAKSPLLPHPYSSALAGATRRAQSESCSSSERLCGTGSCAGCCPNSCSSCTCKTCTQCSSASSTAGIASGISIALLLICCGIRRACRPNAQAAGVEPAAPEVLVLREQGPAAPYMQAPPWGGHTFFSLNVVSEGPLGLSLQRSDAAGGGLVVLTVDPAQQCAGMGVCAQDVLHAINGRDVASDQLAMQRLAERPLHLVFRRPVGMAAPPPAPALQCVACLPALPPPPPLPFFSLYSTAKASPPPPRPRPFFPATAGPSSSPRPLPTCSQPLVRSAPLA